MIIVMKPNSPLIEVEKNLKQIIAQGYQNSSILRLNREKSLSIIF